MGLKANARLDDLLEILVQVTNKYFSRQLARDLEMRNTIKSICLQRYENFHSADDETIENYQIVKHDNVTFSMTQKQTNRKYWLELVSDSSMPVSKIHSWFLNAVITTSNQLLSYSRLTLKIQFYMF